MTKKKRIKSLVIAIAIIMIFSAIILIASKSLASDETADYYVNLNDLTYLKSGDEEYAEIKVYTSDDYDEFVTDYTNGDLPQIYITEFLYDGVSMVKKISLDDDTGEVTTKTISTTAININVTGSIDFTGTAEDTMIAVNTNEVSEDITLILDNVNLTSSSSTPGIMIYNKSISYSDCNVTIKTIEGTNNYITGGKLKKVSTMTTDKVDTYSSISSIYSDISSEYYYVYTSSEVANILYAQETADNEKISEGSPYTYYKYSGAIGSDIEINFEGKGYLEVASQGDEGIEAKGNVNFIGGTGDYKITSYDDGINASTTGTDILINVNSMYVSVNSSGDEGDAIDSNGTIHIEGGLIYAFSHETSQDDGLDSDQGTYINGGTVIATGNMSDSVSDNSEQEFIKLNFKEQVSAGIVVCVTDTSGIPVMAFESDRSFTTLTYSSSSLTQNTYYVYKGGTISGTNTNGLYTKIDTYTDGTQQQWSNGDGSAMGGGENPPDKPEGEEGGETPPDKPDGDGSENGETGDSSVNIVYSGDTEITEDTTASSKVYSSETSNENALLVTGNIEVNLSDITVTKTGDSNSGDDSNFYGINSAVLAKSGAVLTITGATITTDAEGANGVFSYGGSATTNNTSSNGTTVIISDSTITTTGDNSGGIMTTGGGITKASNLIITTSGTSSAAIRTDRGGGTVTVNGGTYTTTGSGSPTIYSTANISVSNASLIAKASEGIVIEGANSVTIDNCDVTDSNTKLNGQSTTYKNIFLYQSVSGDASEGTATFTATDSDIVTNNGDTFYITNTEAVINLESNTITNNDSDGYLLRAQADSWGNSGSNGGSVTLNATSQELNGDINIDSISTLEMNLSDGSSYSGTINADNTAKSIALTVDSTSKLILTGDSYITSLDIDDYSNITFNGYSLYVNGIDISTSASALNLIPASLTSETTSDTTEETEANGASIEFTLSSSLHTFNNVTNYVASENDDTNGENSEKTVESIEIANEPTKITYTAGEELDLTGGVIKVTYSDGTTEDISMTDSDVTVSGYDSSETGTQTITVSYGGKTATFSVTVSSSSEEDDDEKTVESIEISSNPSKTSYTEGDELDLTGGVIKVTYSDGSTETISMTDSDVTVSGYDSSETGTQTITVSYGGKTAIFSVTVSSSGEEDDDEKTVVSIIIKTKPTTTYTSGEALDLSGGVITVAYSDGSTEDISMTDDGVTVSGFNTLTLGTQTLTVTYEGATTTLTVYVEAASADEEDKGEDDEEEEESEDEEATSSEKSSSTESTVDTGDNIVLFIIISVVSLGVIIIITKKINKKK